MFKQYLSCNFVKCWHLFCCYWRRWRQTFHTICMSESKCRQCKLVSKLRIHDHLWYYYCSLPEYHITCMSFEFLTKTRKKWHQFSKFRFHHIISRTECFKNNPKYTIKSKKYPYSLYYLYHFITSLNMTLNFEVAFLLSVSIFCGQWVFKETSQWAPKTCLNWWVRK